MKNHFPKITRFENAGFLLATIATFSINILTPQGFSQTPSKIISKIEKPDVKTQAEKPLKSKYISINTSEKVMAFTFDDGPLLKTTPKLLDILKQHDAKATFFVVGNMVKWHNDTLKRIANEGHEIANHTMDHPNIADLNDRDLISNLSRLNEMIASVTGVKPKTFRPPFGTFRKGQDDLIFNTFGMSTIMWNVDPQDWKSPGVSVVVDRIVNGAKPGGIVVCHDIMDGTIAAMPTILTKLKQQGYRFVTVSELIKYEDPNYVKP